MQVGIQACSLDWEHCLDWPAPKPLFGKETKYWDSIFKVPATAKVTSWVKENQTRLLERCLDIRNPQWNLHRISDMKDFITKCGDIWGAPIIPVGWCMGSDMAYLLDLLGEDCDLVHYSNRDLSGILTGLTGQYDPPDAELPRFLNVEKNKNEHNALADAHYQLEMVKSAMLKAWQQACLIRHAKVTVDDLIDLDILQMMETV